MTLPARPALATLLLVAGVLASCAPQSVQRTEPPPAVQRPLPSYAEVAQAHNARVAPLASLFATHSARVTYIDDEGDRQVEQAEGIIQAVFPDKLALSIGKVGKRVFWFGGDGERYWWFDLREDRTAYVGSYDNFDRTSHRIGLTIHPLDLIRVLGVLPLPDPPEPGATQWSSDGRLLGVTTRIRNNGYQRMWLDPASYEPQKIELFNAARELVLLADLESYTHAEVRDLSVGPRIATRVNVLDPVSGVEVRLTMDSPSDGVGRINADAFDFDVLRQTLGVERVVDLDRDPPPVPPAPAR